MPIENNRLEFLLKALADNTISAAELAELADFMQLPENNQQIFSEMQNLWQQLPSAGSEIDVAASFDDLQQQLRLRELAAQKPVVGFWKSSQRWIGYAAIFMAVLGFGMLGYQSSHTNGASVAEVDASPALQTIAQELEGSLLTLADGRRIAFDKQQTGELAEDKQALILKDEQGQLRIKQALGQGQSPAAEAWNTLQTAHGRMTQILLSDGTKVWLNALSSLKFPTTFVGDRRQVELVGEGYFEVAKDVKRPFSVKTNAGTIQVLGTHFNVQAFNGDSHMKTRVSEGRVQVSTSQQAVILTRGKQAFVDKRSGNMRVDDVAAEDIAAWKQGYFIFHNESIEELMASIARWYQIDVTYQGPSNTARYGGKYSRSSSLQELLQSLALTGTVKFKSEGRRVIVMQ